MYNPKNPTKIKEYFLRHTQTGDNLYQAVFQALSPLVDKDNIKREIIVEVYYGNFPTKEEALTFARQSRIGITKQKHTIELSWYGNDTKPYEINETDIHFLPYNDTSAIPQQTNSFDIDDYTYLECLNAIWNYDDFGGDQGFMWLNARAYGSREL